MHLIILAAGRGTRLRPLIDDRPKCLIPLRGRPLLEWQISAAREAGVARIVVVGGFCAEQLSGYGDALVVNPDYAATNMVHTLFCAESEFGDGFLLSYGDIAYGANAIEALKRSTAPVSVIVDRQWRSYWEQRFDEPLSDAESLRIDAAGNITSIGEPEAAAGLIEAQYIGLMRFRKDGVDALRETYAAAHAESEGGRKPFGGIRDLAGLFMTDILQGMVDRGHSLQAVPIDGGWVEIDSPHDLVVAERLTREGRLGPLD